MGEAHARWLITGATGFVGHHVLAEAARRNIRVRALVRNPPPPAEFARFDVEWVAGDLGDSESLERALPGVERVLHLAGLTRGSARDLLLVNVEGVRRLVAASRKTAPNLRRFVLVSSLAAAGPGTPEHPRQEESISAPLTAYGRSKLAGEQALHAEIGPIPWTIVRPPIVYGPYERDLFLMFQMAKRGMVPVAGNPGAAYSVVFAPDLAHALFDLAVEPAAASLVLNVAERKPYTTSEMVACMGAAFEKKPRLVRLPSLLVRAAAAGGSFVGTFRRRAPLLSLSKLPEILAEGWVASTSIQARLLPSACGTPFEEGARATAAWYRQEGWVR